MDVIEVREEHRFDEGGLRRFMEAHLEGFRGSLEVYQFAGGQSNPTYFLRDDNGRGYVLRRKPPGKLLPSAHAVDREYRVITALGATDVPVPRTFALCEDPEVLGTAFYLMEYLEGRIFPDYLLPELEQAQRKPAFESMMETMARLHKVDYRAVGLETFGRPGNYFERQIGRWSKLYRASETEHIPAMEKLMEWLPGNIPAGDETTLVHGDFRMGNMIYHPVEPRLIAVLDWELSTVGHPLADLAYNCMPYYFDHDTLDGYRGLDLAPEGYPSEEECVAAYCRHTGRDSIPDWNFYLAFSIFRIAAICQGIMGRVRDGTAAGANAAERGARAPELARVAWEIVAQ